jgi:putative hemolysin
MSDYWLQILLVLVLMVLNAIFAGSELALISLRESQLQRLERRSRGGRTLARLARDPNRYLATIQIGITLAGFLASATAAVALAAPLTPLLSFLGGAARPVSIVVVTIVLTFLTLVFGELAPKRVALQRAESWALAVAGPLNAIATMARPAVWLLGRATDVAVRLLGADPRKQREDITPDEIRDLVATQRGFTQEQRLIISGAVEITERLLREVLVPRRAVFTLDADAPIDRARDELAAAGHSRAPVVHNGNLDDVVGTVHWSDLIKSGRAERVADLARPAVLLPDSLHVSDALRRFKSERQQIALVVDEHGAVDGIVTLEDLLEEVVGEIYDETDPDVQAVQRDGDGSLELPGTFPMHDLADVGVFLDGRPNGGDYTTVAGMVLALLGHLPAGTGETVSFDGWTAEVAGVDRHAITKVRLRPAAALTGEPAALR